jgi:hypothetical protein
VLTGHVLGAVEFRLFHEKEDDDEENCAEDGAPVLQGLIRHPNSHPVCSEITYKHPLVALAIVDKSHNEWCNAIAIAESKSVECNKLASFMRKELSRLHQHAL